MSRKLYLPILLIAAMLLLAACPSAAPAPAEPAAPADQPAAATEAPAEAPAADTSGIDELSILWAQWDPADYLQQVGNLYEEETGIKVNIVQEPWGSFFDLFATEMASQGDTWDMVVGDSQWLGQMATQGHYLDITNFLVDNGIKDTVVPATLVYYGEYPTGSGTYWAYPTEGDADGFAYRKDLFENPDEMAAFEKEFGYPLDIPQDYDQFMDIAKFFTRPDDGLYGVAIYTQKDYDALTMGYENTLFPFGADWKDADNNVMGVINSPEAVAAAEYYRELYDCCQAPGLSNAFFSEVNDAMISGQAAMGMNYFAFFPALVNPGTNPDYYDKMGFFQNPAGPSGERGAALGGQGLSVVSHISPERQQAALDFIKWFSQDDMQAKWAEFGGYTTNQAVFESEEFLNATPYNRAFAQTMQNVKDFWNIPEFGQLLEVAQRELSAYIVGGEGNAQDTMDRIAEEHDKILREAGYIQ
ncbi:MAG: extracellular solute-binding protein [Caldilineae bacterium]|nr:extracellular solute-binding protein [Anaerolineae bacterium]MCB0198963.1 extracellular solute-binding protein [Anaerolineae bacterium]MCB0255354.1 extracellular solute-binding protein [Anaerolineae bacterium]MCB9154708.1 extracellular solute-binding protein [Caldilineae bacterium]